MKSGELRRFRGVLPTAEVYSCFSGSIFMVLETVKCDGGPRTVTILVDGKVAGPVVYQWLKESSEVVSEAG